MTPTPSNKRKSTPSVAVALSGGVDSSMACALMVEQGYQTFGVTMRLGIEADSSAIRSARRVAEHLGIPHRVVDLSDTFEDAVVDHFVSEYLRGRTPNPCTVCNPSIKFSALWRAVGDWSPDYMATGHYARLRRDEQTSRWLLYRASDSRKDQTYMLYRLQQYQLQRALFPLGEMTKDEVRSAVTQRGLPVAGRPESQDVCFVQGDYRNFLRRRSSECIEPGPIVDADGSVLGEHRGLPFYTVGQRRGLGISAPEPLYVLHMDRPRNALVVGPRQALQADGAEVHHVNLLPFDSLREPMQVEVQIRYNARPAGARISPAGDARLKVEFFEPQFAVTPGQAAVFYCDSMLVGGGVIAKSVHRLSGEYIESPAR